MDDRKDERKRGKGRIEQCVTIFFLRATPSFWVSHPRPTPILYRLRFVSLFLSLMFFHFHILYDKHDGTVLWNQVIWSRTSWIQKKPRREETERHVTGGWREGRQNQSGKTCLVTTCLVLEWQVLWSFRILMTWNKDSASAVCLMSFTSSVYLDQLNQVSFPLFNVKPNALLQLHFIQLMYYPEWLKGTFIPSSSNKRSKLRKKKKLTTTDTKPFLLLIQNQMI